MEQEVLISDLEKVIKLDSLENLYLNQKNEFLNDNINLYIEREKLLQPKWYDKKGNWFGAGILTTLLNWQINCRSSSIMADKNIKQIIQEQYLKCSQDPIYFMRQFCYIQHPTKGKIKFDLYEFQEESLNTLQNNRYNVILKSRQLGISTLSAGYALWSNVI